VAISTGSKTGKAISAGAKATKTIDKIFNVASRASDVSNIASIAFYGAGKLGVMDKNTAATLSNIFGAIGMIGLATGSRFLLTNKTAPTASFAKAVLWDVIFSPTSSLGMYLIK